MVCLSGLHPDTHAHLWKQGTSTEALAQHQVTHQSLGAACSGQHWKPPRSHHCLALSGDLEQLLFLKTLGADPPQRPWVTEVVYVNAASCAWTIIAPLWAIA